MKKSAVILLLIMYGATTMGATVHLHYCMEKFVGWSLWHNKDNKCGKCGMKEKKDGCCKDEHKQFKLKTEHPKNTAVSFVSLWSVPALPVAVDGFQCVQPLPAVPVFYYQHAPPGADPLRLYLLHCVFRI